MLEGENIMEQETLIYIEEDDRNEAARSAKSFAVEEIKIRAYTNSLAAELAMKLLAQEGINVSNIYNMHNIRKILEEFDIADIMLPNIHIDVRMVYDENLIFVPKSHFEFDFTPDIYLVFKMLEDNSNVNFLGFFEPKLINKNNQNDEYYFIEKEKLSHPSDLKNYIESFNGNTTEALSEEEMENCQRLAMTLIDNDIADNDKKNLINKLVKSSALREALAEFDNFEWISYHVASSETFEDIKSLADINESQTDNQITDEFDLFDTNDEFSDFTDDAPEVEDFDISLSEEDLTDNTLEEKPDEEIPMENTDIINPECIETENQETEVDTEKTDISEELDNIYSPPDNEIENLDEDFAADEIFNEETIQEVNEEINTADNTDLPGIEEVPAELSGEIVEKIHLDEFNELPFDTVSTHDDNNLSIEETPVEDLSFDNNINFDEPAEETHLESLNELLPPEEENIFEPELQEEEFNNEETVALEDFAAAEQNEAIENTEDETSSTETFETLEMPEDNELLQDEETSDYGETVSFEDFTTVDAQDTSEETFDEQDETLSLEELASNNNEILNSDENDDFLETLANDTAPQANESELVSYENSTSISNENSIPGEISIDINQPTPNTSDQEDTNIEKLGVLYNENNTLLSDVNNELKIKTSMPEKGKKAIIVAGAAIIALTTLLIYGSFTKSNNTNEQNNSNVLEKNLPKLEEQPLPEDIADVTPKKIISNPKLEDAANEAAQNINKQNAPVMESPYIEIKKLSWAVPDYISYNDSFKKYLQTAGKSLKLSLSSDLLLATEYAYSNQIQVDIVLSKEGVIQDAKILQSSGSTQIDDIVLRTVKDTLKVVKAPAGVIVGDNIHLTLKIYL